MVLVYHAESLLSIDAGLFAYIFCIYSRGDKNAPEMRQGLPKSLAKGRPGKSSKRPLQIRSERGLPA
jgi:hypothetical protein